jgi:hypothetical protein
MVQDVAGLAFIEHELRTNLEPGTNRNLEPAVER